MKNKCCIFDDVERKMIVKDESLEITRVYGVWCVVYMRIPTGTPWD